MEYNAIMDELEVFGTEENRKIYQKHGETGELFGVSIANIKKLRKKIGIDSSLALKLWQSGNYDARILAMLIIDSKSIDIDLAKNLVVDISNYMHSFYLAEAISHSPISLDLFKLWSREDREFYQTTAYDILAILLKDNYDLPKDLLLDELNYIKEEIHNRTNRAKYSMNNVLIGIGVYREDLRGLAIEIAKNLGRVEVFHGKTSCKTPVALDYIEKTLKKSKG